MADMTARGLEDSAIIQQQQERITFLEEQFEQNKKAEAEKEKERLKSMDKWLATKVEEMMAEFMNSRTEAAPQDIPIPETPQPQIRFSVPPTGPNIGQHRFTTSTPYTAAHGRDNPETPHPQNMHGGSSTYNFERGRTRPGYTPRETPNETPAASPAETRFGNNRDVKLPEEGEFTGLIDAKKANITFDGTDVEGFIKRLENIASILKCGSISLARQLPYIINNNKIGRSIELMEGHETGDWELLKKSLLRKWGRATPLRRYREESITELVQKAVDKKGIKTNVEYRKFISEFEEMMDYFIRMEYNNLNPENGDPLWKALSDELKKEVTKELAHAKKLKKTKDGRNIIPNLSILKIYVEEALVILDFDGEEEEVTAKKTVKIQEPVKLDSQEEAFKKAMEQRRRDTSPHFSRPPSPHNSDGRPRTGPYNFECYYCKGKHSVAECEDSAKDYRERKFYKSGGIYYYPNKQPIVLENDLSVKDMVHKYFEQNQPSTRAQPNETNKDPLSSIAEIEEWGSWIPPSANIDEEELQNNIGFGIRKSQRIQEKNPVASSQPVPGPAQQPVIPTNSKEPTRQRRNSLPGAWIENEAPEEEDSITQTPGKNPAPAKKKPANTKPERKDDLARQMADSLAKKFYKQTYTLTLEEILKIAPQFLQTLQKSLPDSEELEKSINIGRIQHQQDCNLAEEEQGRLTYACPVGMVDMTINDRKIRTLVDTGAEMNIIPEELANQLGFVTTEIFMRLRGIGGHFTPIVGLAENVDVSIFPGHKNLANFFIVKGSVHTVLGRPFLADHNVRLELSNEKGEVLSFQDPLGKRLCIPICLPNVPGWHREPPMFRQNCSLQVVDWDMLDQIKDKNVDVLEADWEQLEKDEEYQKIFSSTLHPPRLDTIPEELTKGKDEQQEDPWNVKLAEPVDWVEELGGYKVTDEEQEQIDQQFAQSEVAWAAEPKPYNSIADYYWKDKSFPRRFRNVFDESERPKTLRRNQGWLLSVTEIGAQDLVL
ncbi:hypothetical protein PCASD_20792 [Puccinia coronata f. sp. avenae]|uniref:Peptidase A2 domain-containing protein n=2 Tax=Puccinia coronata f. sp. avenae TaxID=200324 RepID=A0A2N5TTG4_9BASI|nr:hypothetical protein PCASD_20792 [Puccinia coronata f. sp. avenae]